MQRRSAPFLAAALTASLLTVAAPGPAGAAISDKARLIGLTAGNKIVAFDTATPTLGTTRTVDGLEAGDELVGIDVRPADGQLYALGKTSRLYTIDPDTAKATKVGAAPFTPALEGTKFGFDFNPTVDRIRVVSDTGQNLRLNPTTGATAATDSVLAYKADDLKSGPPGVTAAAYTNSFPGSASPTTTLFDIDPSQDVLVIQNPPNGGVLNSVGTGLGLDATEAGGFDIDVAPGVGTDGKPATANVGLASLVVAGVTGLYTIDLSNGTATFEGKIGDGTTPLTGLAVAPVNGYWLFGADGAVFNFGDGDKPGEAKGINLTKPMVGGTATPSGEGYWLVASDGGIFNYGDAPYFGSTGAMTLNKPIVGMAAYPDGNGYWLVASDGGIFSFPRPGDPDRYFGSTGNLTLNKPVVGMAPYPNGNGYWLVAEDGGIFSFHDKTKAENDRFYGSTGNLTLNKPIKAMAVYPDGLGYWFVAADGGLFSFVFKDSTNRYYSSLPERNVVLPAGKEVVGMATTPSGAGYWMAGADGAVYAFGDAKDLGNAVSPKPAKPIVGISSVF